ELRLRRPSRKEMREAERAEREQNLELERIAQQEAAEKAAKEAEINAVPARKSIFDRFSEDENSSEEPESESVEVEEPTGFEDFLTEAEEEIQANESTLTQTVEVTTQAEPELEVEQTPSLRERLFSRMRRNHSFEQVLASTPETKTLADDEKAVADAAVSEDKAEEVEAAQDAVEVLNSEEVLEEVREIDLEETEIPVDSEVENLSEDSVAVEETEVEENVEETEVEETTELDDAIDTSDAAEIEETVVDEEVVSELDSELTESEENLQESVEETLEEKISGDDTLSVPEVSDAQVQPLGVVEEVETAEEEVAVAAESVSIRSWIIFALLVLIVAVLGYLGGSWIHNTFFAAPAGEQLIENLQSFLL
ncbi:MAG: hypothetical protein SPG61_00645, partial [Arcanobacterium sp.]|nr:hypothetical protein [Arcanobacterium sp.]